MVHTHNIPCMLWLSQQCNSTSLLCHTLITHSEHFSPWDPQQTTLHCTPREDCVPCSPCSWVRCLWFISSVQFFGTPLQPWVRSLDGYWRKSTWELCDGKSQPDFTFLACVRILRCIRRTIYSEGESFWLMSKWWLICWIHLLSPTRMYKPISNSKELGAWWEHLGSFRAPVGFLISRCIGQQNGPSLMIHRNLYSSVFLSLDEASASGFHKKQADCNSLHNVCTD